MYYLYLCGFSFTLFYPRPHARGDLNRLITYVSKFRVSIHAPTQGATRNLPFLSSPKAFQSTPPRKGATYQLCLWHSELLVSIHAPTQGATTIVIIAYEAISSSNPRPPRKGRLDETDPMVEFYKFQSTPPRKGRPPLFERGSAHSCFNPRPHARGDRAGG